MGKDSFRFDYDPAAAMRNCSKLLGMEMTQRGRQLEGGYYITGEPHPYRKDKLKVYCQNGTVWVSEEGGRCISLTQWLIEFGGAADYKEAIKMVKGESQAMHWNGEFRKRIEVEQRFVSPDVLAGCKRFDLRKCNLFNWMCKMFPEEKVREAWDIYNVTTDSHGNTCFWYVNQEGKILYDKRIAYKEDGHRDKSFFPGRQFRVGDGFSGRCYFGACLHSDGKRVFVCESEKSAILGYIYWGRRFVATGGKGNLREIEPDMVLVPDMDARIEWEEKGEVWRWWEKWPAGEVVPDHADVGDLIERRLLCASGK